jgi:Ca2+-binding RTX toxin-like protein
MAFDFENLDDYLDHYTANSSTVIVDSNNGNGTLEFIGSDDAEFMTITSLGDNALRFSSRGANSTSDVEIEGLAINRVRVEGRGGNDTIDGSAQENAEVALEIRGGAGSDSLTGGAGPDTFLFGTATENGRVETDVITDYDRGEDDVVDLSGTGGVISTRVIAGDLHLTLGNDRDILVIQNVTSRDDVMFIL